MKKKMLVKNKNAKKYSFRNPQRILNIVNQEFTILYFFSLYIITHLYTYLFIYLIYFVKLGLHILTLYKQYSQ